MIKILKSRRILVFGVLSIMVLLFAGKFIRYSDKTSTELGYNFCQKLLIVHADDLGLTESTNEAFFQAKKHGVINSASIIVTGRAYDEILAYAVEHPEFDWGIHLTLTSSWEDYKMAGVSERSQISTILDEQGYFYKTREDIYQNADLNEVYHEVKSQVETALKAGLKISHLDSHMGVLYHSSDFLRLYLKLGEEFDLPVFIPKWNIVGEEYERIIKEFESSAIIVDYTFIRGEEKQDASLIQLYDKFFDSLNPGISQMLIHPACDVDELKAFMGDKVSYGADWRRKEYDYFNNPDLKNRIGKQVKFVTWSELWDKKKALGSDLD